MHLAAKYGKLNVIEYYLNKLQGDKNPKRVSNDEFKDQTPLHSAAQSGHFKIVEAISREVLNKNPRDIHGLTPLHYAASVGNQFGYSENPGYDIVVYITENLEPGTNINPPMDVFYKRRTPLHVAASMGHIEIVKYLATRIEDVNVKDTDNLTPYDLAIKTGQNEVGNFLFNLVSIVPENAEEIVTAVRNGNLESLKQLLQKIG